MTVRSCTNLMYLMCMVVVRYIYHVVPTTDDLQTTRYSRLCSVVCVHCGGGGDGCITDTRYYILTSIFYTYTVEPIEDFAYILHNAMYEIR